MLSGNRTGTVVWICEDMLSRFQPYVFHERESRALLVTYYNHYVFFIIISKTWNSNSIIIMETAHDVQWLKNLKHPLSLTQRHVAIKQRYVMNCLSLSALLWCIQVQLCRNVCPDRSEIIPTHLMNIHLHNQSMAFNKNTKNIIKPT